MSAAITLPQGVELCHLPAEFRLACGGVLRGASLAFERQGPAGAPVVVVLGGISAGRHVSAHRSVPGPGWWEGSVGDGLPIDTNRFQVLGIDWLGGCGSSTAPGAGESFPFVAAEDQAAALAHLLTELRIERLHVLVGSSYGGMVGLQFAARFPQRLAHLCTLGAAHQSHPQASAWRAVQRGIVELGLAAAKGPEALRLARALAMTTYRTPGELADRFAGPGHFDGQQLRQPVQDWLDSRGAEFASRWLPEQFLCLNASIDAHRLDPATVAVPTTVCAFVGDQLVPPAQVRELAARLPRLREHREIRSRYGHDAFLKERLAVGALLREVLS